MLLSSVLQLWGEPGHSRAYSIALPCSPALSQDLFIDTEKKTVCVYILYFIYNMCESCSLVLSHLVTTKMSWYWYN